MPVHFDHGLHQRPLVGVSQAGLGEDLDLAALNPVASFGRGLLIDIGGALRLREGLTILEQRRLILLHLHDGLVTGLMRGFQRLFLAVQGIKGKNAVRQAQLREERLGRRNLIGLFCNLLVRQNDARLGPEGTQHLNRLLILEMVKTAPQDLAIEAHPPARGLTRGQIGTVRSKTHFDLRRRCALNNLAQARVSGQPFPVQAKELVESVVMGFDEGMHFPVRRGPAQHGQDRKGQNVLQGVAPTLGTTMILDLRQETL